MVHVERVDRRGAPRYRAQKSGKIICPETGTILDCVIGEMSSTGVRLLVSSPLAVPRRFELTVRSQRSQRAVSCRVVWRSPGEVGVAFE